MRGCPPVPPQLVVLSQVLAADATLGYEGICNQQVLSFNGSPVVSLAALAAAVSACRQGYLRFELDSGEAVVLDAAAAGASTAAVLAAHSIPAAASRELLPLLGGAA